jgi:outer membrane protein assembly factor BamB
MRRMSRYRFLALAALAALVLVPTTLAGSAATPISGWLSFSNSLTRTNFLPAQYGIADPSALKLLWATQVDGVVSAQPLVVRDIPNPGDLSVYIVTGNGNVEVLNQNGYVVAKRQLGHMFLKQCTVLPGSNYGITGTPVIDPVSHTLYVADALGYVHALDPVTLQDLPGWPVRLFKQPQRQLVWGALTLVKGKIYASTGLLCAPGSGSVYSVDIATKKVARWIAVPLSLGGGGGMWGWGGIAYDPRTSSLLAVTGDALVGGRNIGKNFDESAAYAEHIVQLGLDLKLRASQEPQHYKHYVDQDLTGTPVVIRASGCPALVAGESKNGTVYAWRLNRIASGVYWRQKIAPQLNGQPAWSPLTRSLYVVGHQQAFRFQLTSTCKFNKVWSVPLVGASVNGPPLIFGNTIWFTVAADQTLWTMDATTGQLLWKGGLAEPAYAPPTILDGRVYEAGFPGLVSAFG